MTGVYDRMAGCTKGRYDVILSSCHLTPSLFGIIAEIGYATQG